MLRTGLYATIPPDDTGSNGGSPDSRAPDAMVIWTNTPSPTVDVPSMHSVGFDGPITVEP